MFIESDLYKEIISKIPITCVDIVVRNELGDYLLIKRKQQPFKNIYWIIGGRINIGETIKEAVNRKMREEISIDISENKIEYMGFYEDFFEEYNIDGNDGEDMHAYHTISLIFSVTLASEIEIKLDKDHSNWKWSKELPKQLTIQ